MASSESSSSPLLWIGGAILAVGYAILGGYWLYAITTAVDVPTLALGGIFALLTGFAVLLIAVIRDRIIHKKKENFLEVDN